METKLNISANYSEFKSFLQDCFFKLYGSHRVHIIETLDNNYHNHLQYTLCGGLIDYVVIPIGQNLEVTISSLIYSDDKTEKHIKEITDELQHRFLPASLPMGFKSLIKEKTYSKILEDMWSQSIITENAGAPLSTIILLGSILEGILLYKIKRNKKTSNKSKSAPKDKGVVKSFENWGLEDMINTCFDCEWISIDAKNFSNSIKTYRNYVHPWKQYTHIRTLPDLPTCAISRQMISSIFNELCSSRKS